MGTPSYMAPEQARGEVDAIDERADVFALGSILCEVLTGPPAFTGRTSAEIQRKAARGETAEALARLEACGADAELVAPGPRLPGRRAGGPAARRRRRGRAGRRPTWPACRSGSGPPSSRRVARAEARAAEERQPPPAPGRPGRVAAGRCDRRRPGVDLRAAPAAGPCRRGSTGCWPRPRLLRDQARAKPDDAGRWERGPRGRRPDRRGPAARRRGARGAAPRGRGRAGGRRGRRACWPQLVDIRSAQADDPDGSATDAAYAAAFAAAGLDLDARRPAEAGRRLARRPRGGGRGPGGLPRRLGGRPPRRGTPQARAGGGRWPRPAPPTPTRTATPSARSCWPRTGPSGWSGCGRWPTAPTPGAGPRPACPAGQDPGRRGDADAGVAVLRRGLAAAPGRRLGQLRARPAAGAGAAAAAGRGDPRLHASPAACGRSWPGTSWPTLLERRGRGAEAEAVFRDLVGRRPDNPPPGLLRQPPEGARPRGGGRPGARPGDRRVPRGDPAEARRRRGPRQPRHRPARLGRPGRRDRGVPRGDPAEARRRRGPQQPRHRPARSGDLPGAIAAYREAIRLQARLRRGPQQPRQRPGASGDLRRGDRGVPRGDPAAGPTTPRPTTTSASPCATRATCPGRSPRTARRSGCKPDIAEAHSNLGNALRDSGDLPGGDRGVPRGDPAASPTSPRPTTTSATPCALGRPARRDRGVPRGDPAASPTTPRPTTTSASPWRLGRPCPAPSRRSARRSG